MTSSRYCQAGFMLLIILSLLSGCGGKKPGAAAPGKPKVEAPVPVDTASITTQPVARTVDFVGSLSAQDDVAVASNVEAPVARVLVDMGDRVAKGQVLVKLDDEEYRIKLDLAKAAFYEAVSKLGVEDEKDLVIDKVSYVRKAKAELDDKERGYNRMKELESKGYVSKSQLDEAQSAYDVSKATYASQIEAGRSLYATVKTKRAQMELAQKQMRDTEVRAPMSGFVSGRSVDAGDYVKAGGEVIKLVDVDPLRFRGEVPEVNAAEVRSGQEVTVRLSASPGKEYKGRITRISPSSNPKSRAFMVEALIPNSKGELKPGYFAEASVLSGVDPSALTAPSTALVMYAGVTKVFVVVGNKAFEKVVTTGARVGDSRVIKGDVKAGDTVVVTGSSKLYDGRTVEARKK